MSADDDRASDKNPRQPNGHYRKGHSGNLRGRPPKPKRAFTESQHRADFFNAAEEEKAITRNGKRKKVPSMSLIYLRLMQKATEGDVRCMFKAIDLGQQFLAGYTAELKELAELAARANRAYRDKPEDFTDEDLEALREINRRLRDPDRIL